MSGKVCSQSPLHGSPREQFSGTQDMLMGEEDAVYSSAINRRQENSGDDGIPQTKGGTRLTPSK